MTGTLTREFIEDILTHSYRNYSREILEALCRLALKARDQPSPPSADVVEKVARAMWEVRYPNMVERDTDAWEIISYQDAWHNSARAAITTLRELGWKEG